MTTKSILSDPILEALFTSRARVAVLSLLFLNSGNRYYLREVASLTGQPVRAIQRELARLEKSGLVIMSIEGNRKYFQANPNSQVYPEVRSLVVKTAGLGGVLSQHLADSSGIIHVAFLFGSYARGSEASTSDIDLMVIGPIDGQTLSGMLKPAREILEREVNSVIMDPEELRVKYLEANPFLLDVLENPKIFLVGDDARLQELARSERSSAS
jgi:predicted nucleotidyltransferase